MLFAVIFEDNEGHAATRAAHMQDHLSFIEANAEVFRAAGPLFDGVAGAGGMWLVDAADADAVRALIAADPFHPTGLRKSARILEWRRVFHDGARRV